MVSRLALIVEDNIELGTIYAAALEAADFEIEHIADGRKALQRLDELVPTLIILDMNLPHVSGHYIYKKVRSDERFAKTPVIIATANALIADALGSEIAAMDKLMIKPVSPSQLRTTAATMVQQIQGSG
jgi:DNA-binding response OmpR family regulator